MKIYFNPKKIWELLLVIGLFVLLFTATTAAQIIYVERSPDDLPKTYDPTAISLMEPDPYTIMKERLHEAWDDFSEMVVIEDLGIHESEIKTLYFRAIDESPYYFYVMNAFGYSRYSDGTVYAVSIYYTTSDTEAVIEARAKIDMETEKLLSTISGSMTDFQKVMAVHDYIVVHYQYDTTYQNRSITIMYTYTGVCQSYARTFYYIMGKLGIPCTFVPSDEMNHLWNLVMIDGQWYHIDTTWDDPLPDVPLMTYHRYALLSTEQIQLPLGEDNATHYGFDTGELDATSTLYDNAPWHTFKGTFAFINGVSYYADGVDLVTDEGKIIFSPLSSYVNPRGERGWSISATSYLKYAVLSGFSAVNGKLYFNTDNRIYVYDPTTDRCTVWKQVPYLCGLYVDTTSVATSVFDFSSDSFVLGTSYPLVDVRIRGAYRNGDHMICYAYLNEGASLHMYAAAQDGIHSRKLSSEGLYKLMFPYIQGTILYSWDDQMRPYCYPQYVTEN